MVIRKDSWTATYSKVTGCFGYRGYLGLPVRNLTTVGSSEHEQYFNDFYV